MSPSKYTKYFTSCKGVFQGGGCKAIAYVGAYKKAYERGVFFSELAGTSAGSIIAAFIAGGAKPEYLEKVVRNLNFKEFITKYKKANKLERFILNNILPKKYKKYCKYLSKGIIQSYGIFDAETIENFVEEHLRILTGLEQTVTFEDLIPNLHIVCADLERHTLKVWNKDRTPSESVAKAVRCSCSIPFFFQPAENKYVDGGILSNLPSFIFAEEPHYNRILNFKLESNDTSKKLSSFADFIISLIDTIVEGASNIQENLNAEAFDVSIKVDDVSSIDFEQINEKTINCLIHNGEEAMDLFLNEELTFISDTPHKTRLLKSKEQMRSLVSYICLEQQKEIYVSCENTYWCWELFLSLVRWIDFGSKVTIITSSIQSKYADEENSRRRMLKAMGCNIVEVETISVNGYFFMEKKDLWKGIVFKEGANNSFSANYYSGSIDSILIKEWVLKLKQPILQAISKPHRITIKSVKQSIIISRLRTESIYENASLKFELVNLDDLYFMNPYIRALKYKQIDKMYELYDKNNIPPFTSAALYFNKKESLIGPPIAELHNGKLYIIEGNTRCVYAYKHGINMLQILVVRDITAPIPCSTKKVYKVSDILISDAKITGQNRYTNFDYTLFRHIEESIRPYKDYML